MTTFEEDAIDGGGTKPTQEQAIKVRDYLKSRNRAFSVLAVYNELLARNFKVSKATVGRLLKGVEGGNPPSRETPPEQVKARKALHHRKEQAKAPPKEEPPEIAAAIVEAVKESVVHPPADPRFSIEQIAAAEVSSTQLAINENRESMALNLVLIRHMAENPKLLLLDMRGTAALVDALTCSVKMRGGASIDVRVPSVRELINGNGEDHPMKDVTPRPPTLAEDFAKFRAERRKTNGQGA